MKIINSLFLLIFFSGVLFARSELQDKAIDIALISLNKEVPKMIDAVTYLEGTHRFNNKIYYRYYLEGEIEGIDVAKLFEFANLINDDIIKEFQEEMRNTNINQACTDPDIKIILENHYKIQHTYYLSDGKFIFKSKVSLDDCKK